VKLVADLSPLRGGWLQHCPEEYCCHSDVLASPGEEWGLIAPLVVVDAVINIVSLVLGCSAINPARVLLLEGGPKLHQLLAVLIDLGLELAELLELSPSRPLGGRHRGPLPWGPMGSTC
jgi:hypothetical protein